MPDDKPDTIESLRADLTALRASIKAADEGHDDLPEGRPVPYARLAQSRQQLRELTGRLDAAEKALGSALAGLDARVKADVAAAVGPLQQRHVEDLALAAEHGIRDPLGRDLIRRHVETLPEAERKDGAVGWMARRKAALEAHRADATKPAPETPPWLLGYEQTGQTQQPANQAQQRQAAPPRTDTGTSRAQGAGFDMAALMREAGTKDSIIFGK